MAARRVVSKFVQNGRVAVLRMQCEDNRIALTSSVTFTKHWMKFVVSAPLNPNSNYNYYLRVPTVKAVITTGEGKFYSNGLDVEYLLSLDVKKRLDLLSDAQRVPLLLSRGFLEHIDYLVCSMPSILVCVCV